MSSRIQLRRGSAAAWTSANPLLLLGEIGLETDTKKFKVGDGSNLWTGLPYFATTWDDIPNLPSHLSAGGGAANGYATLDSNGRVPASQLPNSVMEYQGTWDASTNAPPLVDGTGSAGDVYRVGVASSRNLGSGAIDFQVGDYVIYSGSVWQKADTTDAVASVAGNTGVVTQDQVTGLSSTGMVKRSGTNTLAIAAAGTDYVAPGGVLGTPSSGTLTNCSGLPISGISATGTADSTTYLRGNGTWATPTGISTGKAIAMAIVFG